MSKRALVFFPQNPEPPSSGFHRRGLEIMAGLRELGYASVLVSSSFSTAERWSVGSVLRLKERYVSDVCLHVPTALDLRISSLVARFYERRGLQPPISSLVKTPPGMRGWFTQTIDRVEPDLLVMNYVIWEGLVNHRRFHYLRRIVDMIDLVTLNRKMWRALEAQLPAPPIDAGSIPDSIVSERFFTDLNLRCDPKEFEILERYNCTIAIAQKEKDLVQAETRQTTVVVHIPMTQPLCDPSNRHSGPALFTTGPNPFNTQGLLYFMKRVLPVVRVRIEDFTLQVTGHSCGQVRPVEGLRLSGFVPDLTPVYESARFAICPVFGLAGRQVKIVEAMAHGVPVIALRAAAERSPLQHELNGLVASNAVEFAEHVVRLWQDPLLCRRLGSAARETIRSEFTRNRMLEKLASVIDRPVQERCLSSTTISVRPAPDPPAPPLSLPHSKTDEPVR